MRSERLLREVVRGVLLEKVVKAPKPKKPKKPKEPKEEPPPRKLVTLSSDDIFRVLEINLGKKAYSELHGVTIFVPYRTRETPLTMERYKHLQGLIPFDVVSTVKYDTKNSKNLDGTLLTLKAEEGAADTVIDGMASRIEYGFRNEPVAAVTCVDSSHGMSAALAKAVADKLGVPYQPIVKKTMDINLTWDPDQWAIYEDMVRSTGLNGNGDTLTIKVDGMEVPATPEEYLNSAKAVLANELKYAVDLIKAGKKPTMAGGTNTKTGHKRFWNFFDKVATGDLAPGSKVLVVDDNVDSGWTPYHVAKRCREAGLEPLFAVGFKMMRYTVKKVPKPSLISQPFVADNFAVDLFQVGVLLMAMEDSEEYNVEAADVFKVLKASPAGVELEDIDTHDIITLSGEDLAPAAAQHLWAVA